MCMLTKRTNILFDQELWQTLTAISQKQNISIGELVRRAVADTYSKRDILTKRKAVTRDILNMRPAPVKGRLEYKELINHGRKHI